MGVLVVALFFTFGYLTFLYMQQDRLRDNDEYRQRQDAEQQADEFGERVTDSLNELERKNCLARAEEEWNESKQGVAEAVNAGEFDFLADTSTQDTRSVFAQIYADIDAEYERDRKTCEQM